MLCFIGGVRVAHLFSWLCFIGVRVAHRFIGVFYWGPCSSSFYSGVRVAVFYWWGPCSSSFYWWGPCSSSF